MAPLATSYDGVDMVCMDAMLLRDFVCGDACLSHGDDVQNHRRGELCAVMAFAFLSVASAPVASIDGVGFDCTNVHVRRVAAERDVAGVTHVDVFIARDGSPRKSPRKSVRRPVSALEPDASVAVHVVDCSGPKPARAIGFVDTSPEVFGTVQPYALARVFHSLMGNTSPEQGKTS